MSGRKMNLAKEIGTNYSQLGIFLLEDDNGEQVSAIEQECMRNAEKINMRIFQLWLNGSGRQPVTWTTLISVLRDVELVMLAENIEKNI